MIWLLVLGSGAIVQSGLLWILASQESNLVQLPAAEGCSPFMRSRFSWACCGEAVFSLMAAAAPKLGKLGPAIGWPLSLVVSLVTANCVGFLTGEWKHCSRTARRWMMVGLAILLVAIGILGWSGRLAS